MTNTFFLGDIAEVFNGKTPAKSEQRSEGYPVLKIRDVDEEGAHRGAFGSYVDEQLAQKYRSKWIVPGDTLILNAAHNADYVGSKTFFAGDSVANALPTGEWLIVRPGERASAAYVNFWIRSRQTRDRIRFAVKGIHLYPKDVAALEISLPLFEEQRRIVDLLSRAEGIVRLRREAQRKAAELVPALFLDMFGDPAGNPKGWPSADFGTLGQLDRGKSRHRPRDAQELYGGSYPFIQTGDVTNSGGNITRFTQTYSELGLAQSRLWPAGTLCITIAANIARTGVLDFDACFPDSVVGFTPSQDVTIEYIQHWLGFLQPTLERNAPQAAQKNINLEILRNLPVPVPPIELQRQFAAKADAVRGIAAQQTAALATAQATFGALLHQSFQH